MKGKAKIIVLTLVLLALLPLSVLAAGISLPEYYGDSYYAQLPLMYKRLRETEGKKIVVIGGSNVAFGLDSGMMEHLLREKGYDYTVCSFGLYAAVGTSAMLDLAKGTLSDGDIVILALEPTSETMSTYFGATAFWKCAESAPELLLGVNTHKREALVGNYIAYLQERWAIKESGILPKAEGVYAKSSFNDRCDLIYDRAGNTMALGYDSSAPVDLAAVTIAPDFAQQVNDFCRAAEKVGATVYLSFSPVNRTALVGDGVEDFFNLCNQAFACRIISDPNDYILDSGWFYDSNFHLNTAGAVVRTAALTEDILACLGCYQPLNFELPRMPGSIAEVGENTADSARFTYDAVPAPDGKVLGYRISGLTEAGMTARELIVPSLYEGKPVVGFTANALDTAAALESLRLPESIESIPDGLLRPCKALTRLILEHRTKLCTVTDNTFNGAEQVKIFVPADAYPLYRDGQGCESNPWAQYLSRIYTL